MFTESAHRPVLYISCDVCLCFCVSISLGVFLGNYQISWDLDSIDLEKSTKNRKSMNFICPLGKPFLKFPAFSVGIQQRTETKNPLQNIKE